MSTPVAGAERTAEELVRGILDSLPQHIALLDRDGVILAVNEPWRRFARQGGARPEAVLEGANYLAACRAAAETGDATAREALAGLTKLFSGACDAFTFEYPCATPERELWFEMHASRAAFGVSKFVVSHADVTTRKTPRRRCARANGASAATPPNWKRSSTRCRSASPSPSIRAAIT